MAKQQKKRKTKRKTAGRQPATDRFARLTWEDVEDWAGSTILTRGKEYQRLGAVQDLARTAEGDLLAWVEGTRRYATRVKISGRTRLKLESECSCPYWATCKHAVAVILVYLDLLQNKQPVPEAAEDDPRLKALKERPQEDYDDFEEEYEEDEDQYGEDEYEEFEEVETARPARTSRRRPKAPASLRDYLRKLSKKELLAQLEQLAREFPEVAQRLDDRQALQTGQTRKMLQAVRQEIAALTEPNWDEDERAFCDGDPARLKRHLQALVAAGQTEAVVRLGSDLLEAGNRTCEREREPESSDELSECLDLVFEALPRTARSPADQMEWAVDMARADEYDLCSAGLDRFWSTGYDQTDWSELADRLQQQLESLVSPEDQGEYAAIHQRDQLSNWVIEALERADRGDEIIPLCEREAPITLSYQRLVEKLMAARRWQEAERWCLKGIEHRASSSPPAFDGNLRKQLRTIAEKRGDKLRAVALVAERFFSSPSLDTFEELRQAACKVKVGEAVEAWARHYLVTGRRPDPGPRDPERRQEDDPTEDWPLPAARVPAESTGRVPEAPMTQVLIDLAIHEKQPGEALKWYDHFRDSKPWHHFAHGSVGAQVAEAVRATHPDRTIEIWKSMAEGQIAQTQVKAYETAGTYLRKVRNLMTKRRRKGEWEAYLKALREANRRKPRCVAMLDRLAGRTRRILLR